MTHEELFDIENHNQAEIHLFCQGMFYRAYERSCVALQAIERYAVLKKHSTTTGMDYIYSGFPTTSLDKITAAHRFVASMVVDASKLYRYTSGYNEPFAAGAENTKDTNAFAYTSARAMGSLPAGAALLVEGRSWRRYTRPAIERYCAVLNDYIPTENQTVELLLQRVSFAVKLSAPDLTEGSITLTIDGSVPIVLTTENTGTPLETIVTTLGSPLDARWLTPDYVDPVVCTAVWTQTNGTRVKLGPAGGITLNARRNQRIPIEIYTRGKPNGLDIATEPTEWTDEPSVAL